MGRDHHRGSEPVQFLEQVHQAQRHAVVDVAGRLVGEQKLGPADDGARDRDALLLSARKGRGPRFHLVLEADPGEQLGDVAAHFRSAHSGDAQRQRDVVERGKVRKQLEFLEHDPHLAAQRRQGRARERRDVAPEQGDDPPGRLQRQVEELEQRGFARAAFPGQEVERTLGEREGHVLQDFGPESVTESRVLEANDVVVGRLLHDARAPKLNSWRSAFIPRDNGTGHGPSLAAGRSPIHPAAGCQFVGKII